MSHEGNQSYLYGSAKSHAEAKVKEGWGRTGDIGTHTTQATRTDILPGGAGEQTEVESQSGGLNALRANQGKEQLSFTPAEQMRATSRALEFGAKKYARNNFRNGLPQASTADSLLRHLMAYLAGETHDPESGLHHVDHINANAAFLAVGVEADWPMYKENKDG